MGEVHIRGDGVAARSAARLLCDAGFHVSVDGTDRARVPALMLGETAQGLLCDVFGGADLFRGLTRIERRVVAWGAGAEPLALPHSAVVISEQELLDRLAALPGGGAGDAGDSDAGSARPHASGAPEAWALFASRPLPAPSVEHHFGSRLAQAVAVDLSTGCDGSASWVESLENGWLFMVPGPRRSAWLLAVGGPAEALLAKSRLVADQIGGIVRSTGEFPAYPRIADPLCGPGWLACGSAALGFDPLCGDGTGHAVREAILAAAVIRAAARGGPVAHLLLHYRTRLLLAFQRHLEICRQFYVSGNSGPWWEGELERIANGLEWCAGELRPDVKFQYRLKGFELERLAAAGPG